MRIIVVLFLSLSLLGYSQDENLEKSMERGKQVYLDFCVNCHMFEGEGVSGAFPPLAGSDYLLERREASIYAIKYGQKGEIIVNGEKYNNIMLPLYLSDTEVADVSNYILNSWGNKGKYVTPEEVAAIKEQE
ncbi:MAG: cytochrome c [Saprospiraceae bacterium]|nr:cytochrome c [Saprospiraceae bacterium]